MTINGELIPIDLLGRLSVAERQVLQGLTAMTSEATRTHSPELLRHFRQQFAFFAERCSELATFCLASEELLQPDLTPEWVAELTAQVEQVRVS